MPDDPATELRKEFTNYERTVWLINCIEGHLKKQYAPHLCFFDRYPKIPQDSESALTPDFTVVFKGPYEIVGEVKRALGRDEKLEQNFEQLKGYDRELSLRLNDGDAYNHKTTKHDLLVLVNLEHAAAEAIKLRELVEGERAKGKFKRAVSVFSATNDGQQAKPRWIMVWQDKSDKLRDMALAPGSRLSERHQEKYESIVVYPDSFAGPQSVHWFCNDNPPLIYLAVILWAKIFPRMMSPEKREAWTLEADCQGIVDIDVLLSEVCDKSKTYLSHSLKKNTVKSVLEFLVKAKLATRKKDDSYVVHFRRFKLNRFNSETEDEIKELRLDHQREGMINAIVRGDKTKRIIKGRPHRGGRKTRFDKNQLTLL
jgi:hypothetical protein